MTERFEIVRGPSLRDGTAPHAIWYYRPLPDFDDLVGMDDPRLGVDTLGGWQFDFARARVTTSAWESRMSDGFAYRERQKEAKA